MKYKSVFIPAKPAKIQESTAFGGHKTAESDAFIDGYDLASECEKACNDLDHAGYEVLSITETTRGNYWEQNQSATGWSMTMGLIITAKRIGQPRS